jgi:hypothetical protein
MEEIDSKLSPRILEYLDTLAAMQDEIKQIIGIPKERLGEPTITSKTTKKEIWASCFLCKKCGKLVERGILNVIRHFETCKGSMDDLENVYDTDYKEVTKQITNGTD